MGTHSGTVACASDWDEPMEIKQVRPSQENSVERLCRLGPCGWCYDAGLNAPDVGPLPLDRNG